MSYKLRREVGNGSVVSISLGVPEVDAYLKFLKHRCRLNTWISYGYDLQIFLNSIKKPLIEVTPADILTFIESQQAAPNRQGRRWALHSGTRTLQSDHQTATYRGHRFLRISQSI